jgi:molybdopterin converting factor small subunit
MDSETGKPAAAMTTIQVVYFGLVRNVVNQGEETLSLAVGSTVRQLMEALCEKHGAALRDAIFTADGTLGSSVMLVLDGTNVLSRQGLETPIGAAQSMHVLLTTTAMAGG